MRRLTTLLILLLTLALPFAVTASEPKVSARLLVSNPTPFLGEELDLLLEVTYNGHPGGRTRFSWPQLDNFVSADLTQISSHRGRDEQNRLVETVTRRIKPLISGTIHLKDAVVIVGDQRFRLQPVTLRVRPLPVAGRPDNFKDRVGTYRLMLAADGSGPREINLQIYDSNQLTPVPVVLPWPGPGERLAPMDTKTRAAGGGGREHILRYFYTPSSGEQGSLRFTLPTYDPVAQRYREVESGPAEKQTSRTVIMLLALGLILAASGWVLLSRRRYPRSIDGCLERICQRSTAGLSREKILEILRPDFSQSESEALHAYWRSVDTDRFSWNRSIEMQNSSALKNSLRQSLWKVIDKQKNFT